MTDYIMILNKPKDITSFSYISKIRKELNIKKIGHAGTLDPMAEGLMLVMINDATKLSNNLMKQDKTYFVELELGYETNTYDLEGDITKKYLDIIDFNDDYIKNILDSFIGVNLQIPPMFSAIKKDGKKLYELARKGIEIELEGRKIEIYNIYDIEIDKLKIKFRCDVSSGTYIRSLVRDIGEKLGCYATMTKLIREKIGKFSLDMENVKIPVSDIFDYSKIEVEDSIYKDLKNGMTKIMKLNSSLNNKYLYVYNNSKFVGIVEILKNIGYNYYIKRNRYFK